MYFTWFFLIIEGFICSFFKSQIPENDDMLCILVIGVSVLIALFEIVANKKYAMVILGGFFFRLCLMIWDLKFSSVYVLPNSGLDTYTFALGARSGYLYGTFGRSGFYGKFIALWYHLFGVQRPIAQYMNVLLSISIIYLTLKILDYLGVNESSKKVIAALLCFLPNFAITNSILLRETIIIYLITVSVYFFFRYLNENRVSLLLLSIIACCLGALFHSGAIAILLGEAVVYVIYDKRNKMIRINQNSILSIAFVIIAYIVIQTLFGNVLFSKFGGIDSADDIVMVSERYNSGGSAYDAGFKFNNSIVSLIVNTPIRMFYFVASPLPWKWRGISDVMAFLFSSLVFIYVYYYAYKELKRGNSNKTQIIVLAIMALSSALIFAWGVSNAGTAVRHREKFIIVYMLLFAVSMSGHQERDAKEGDSQ